MNPFDGIKEWFESKGASIKAWFHKTFEDFLHFFKGFAHVGIFISNFVKNLRNPVKAIGEILLLILGIVMGIVLLLVYVLLTVLRISLAIGLLGSWIVAIFLAILETVLFAVFLVIAFLLFGVLWILNILTGGSLNFLLRCETPPDAWHAQGGFAGGNTWRRALMCWAPCASGWARTGTCGCSPLQASVPDFCPQQQIYATYLAPATTTASARPLFDGYVPDWTFRTASLLSKRDLLLQGLRSKKAFLGACNSSGALGNFDYLNRHICANLAQLPAREYPPETVALIAEACDQAYCDYSLARTTDGSWVASFSRGIGGHAWCDPPIADSPSNLAAAEAAEILREALACLSLMIAGTVAYVALATLRMYVAPLAPPQAASTSLSTKEV